MSKHGGNVTFDAWNFSSSRCLASSRLSLSLRTPAYEPT